VWSDARVVFLFDQFYVPRDAVIATANGYREAKAEDGPSASMAKLSTPHDDVDALWTGHLAAVRPAVCWSPLRGSPSPSPIPVA
jgi:hypothetical protein